MDLLMCATVAAGPRHLSFSITVRLGDIGSKENPDIGNPFPKPIENVALSAK